MTTLKQRTLFFRKFAPVAFALFFFHNAGFSAETGAETTPAGQETPPTAGQVNSRKIVYHITPHRLDQMEDINYANYLRQATQDAQNAQADLIIIEIDTPGGELGATLDIKNTLLSLKARTVCFVNRNAISAGSLIAISCDVMAMAPGSVIGAATPVFMKTEGMQKAPEKVVSAARAAWRGAAEARGRNPRVAEALVDESIVLTKSKDGIDKQEGKLLTMTGEEAVSIGFADYTARSPEEILVHEKMQGGAIVRLEPGFREQAIWFLLHPIVSGLLLGLGFMGLLAEVRSPGWGIPGAFGLIFLSIYFIARIYAGASGWEAPALFAFSILLLLLEIFVIPGFGFAGIMGIIGLIAAILWSYGINNMEEGLWVLSLAMVAAGLAVFFIVNKISMSIHPASNVFLGATLTPENKTAYERLSSLIGKTGMTFTVLRPAGTVMIDGDRIDAVSMGDYIEKNVPIIVKNVEGHKVLVDKINLTESQKTQS